MEALHRFLLGALVVTLGLAWCPPSFASEYVMRAIVKPGDTIDGVEIVNLVNFRMAINENGEVAFLADFRDTDGAFRRGIFTQDRAIVRAGDVVDGFELLGFTTGPGSINESGDVAYFGVFLDPGNTGGIFFAPGPSSPGDPMLLARQGTLSDQGQLTSVGWPAIDDAANVVFSGVTANRHGLFATSPGLAVPTRIVGPGDVIEGELIEGLSGLNAQLTGAGDLRFDTTLRTPPPIRTAILTPTAVLSQGGDLIGDLRLGDFFQNVGINDAGEVVFRSPFTDTLTGVPGTGLFTSQALLVKSGDAVDGETVAAFAGQPATLLNDVRLFFLARLATGTQRALLSLSEVLVRPGDPVELDPGLSEPLVAVQQVAANNQDRILILAFVDSLQEVLVEVVPADTDDDGIPDDADQCTDSNTTETVVVEGCDSATPNLLGVDGCTVSDEIALCAEAAGNHGQFQTCVGQLTNELKKAGLLTGKERAAIQACAGQAAIP